MKRMSLSASLAAALCVGFTVPLLAAQPAESPAARKPSPGTNAVSKIKASKECLRDLRAFDSQMQKDGYWLGGSGYGGYGYGYPIYGYGYDVGERPQAARPAPGQRPATGGGGRDTKSGHSLPLPTFLRSAANSKRARRCSSRPAISTKATRQICAKVAWRGWICRVSGASRSPPLSRSLVTTPPSAPIS